MNKYRILNSIWRDNKKLLFFKINELDKKEDFILTSKLSYYKWYGPLFKFKLSVNKEILPLSKVYNFQEDSVIPLGGFKSTRIKPKHPSKKK